MDIIDSDKFNKEESTPIVKQDDTSLDRPPIEISEKQMSLLMKEMDSPIELMKDIAVKIKVFLDAQIKHDLMEYGRLRGDTRRWAKDYTELLDKIQKGLFGEKSVNLHLHGSISHTQLAAKLRKYKNNRTDDDGIDVINVADLDK